MKTILIVEDNEKNRYLMRFILEKNKYTVWEACNAQTVLDMMNQDRKPDAILMDIQLPDINGIELTRIIRQSGWDGTIPIIAITSYAMTGDRGIALDAGCTGYIEKPINPETIIGEIEQYL
ncbi:MAG: response regulator [Candidatus Marinimicrobia bacterium]|nr:response regulator [Candidatus Neomarinimicrobiota bacterium]